MPQTDYPTQTQPDPVLGSPEDQHHQRGGGFESMPVIDAVPISMVAPEDVLAEPTTKVAKRRSMEEMAKRPEWLPEDWRIDLRVRTSGASTGLIDRAHSSIPFRPLQLRYSFARSNLNQVQPNRPPSSPDSPGQHQYFFDPSERKFRSKHEVLHFLGTGKKLKRNADDVLSGSKKSKNSSSIPLGGLNNVQANSPQRK